MALKDWKKVKGKTRWEKYTEFKNLMVIELIYDKPSKDYFIFTTSNLKHYPSGPNTFKTKKEGLAKINRLKRLN